MKNCSTEQLNLFKKNGDNTKDNEIDDFISRFNIFQKEVTVGMKAIQWEFQAQATLVNTKAHEKTQRFNIKKIG